MEISKRDKGRGMTMTPDEIEAAHDRMDKECDDAMARDRGKAMDFDFTNTTKH